MTGRRGLQTMAKSAGTGDDSTLEAHCRYSHPDGRRDGAMPVNWGWFPLEDGRACLHRIGYSGTDELGRPGNFMAHNLIVGENDLRAINYDVTSLLRWVRDKSDQFTTKSGSTSGFARRHDQIYQKYFQDKAALQQLAPLFVDVGEIEVIRQATDGNFREQTLQRIGTRLGSKGITRLFEAILCEPEQQKIVLVMGMSDGEEESAAEFELAEVLYTLLPLHCRQKLAFSTYHEDPREVTKAKTPHNALRLVMSPATENAKAASDSPQLCVLDLPGERIPASSGAAPMAERYSQAVMQGDVESLLELRDYTNHFDFEDELQGLLDGERLLELRNGAAPNIDDWNVFHRAATCLRPTLVEFLETAHRLVDLAPSATVLTLSTVERLAKDYLQVLQTLLPALRRERGSEATVWEDVVSRVIVLFSKCLEHDSVAVLAAMFDADFGLFRSEAVSQMAVALERELLRADQSRLAALWNKLCQICPRQDADGERFLGSAATQMCNLVLQQVQSQGGRVEVSKEILPLLRDAPLAQPNQLSMRLALLTHACRNVPPEEASRYCGEFLNQLIAGGQLKTELLGTIIKRRKDVMLRFYNEWLAAAGQSEEIKRVLMPVLNDPGLVCTYWQVEPAEHDGTLQRGTRSTIKRLDEKLKPTNLVETLLEPYVREGSVNLCAHFQGPPKVRSHGELVETVRTHCALMALVAKQFDSVSDIVAKDAREAMQKQMTGLMSEVCLCMDRVDKSAPDADSFLIPLLELTKQTHPSVDKRTEFFVAVAQQCHARSQGTDIAFKDLRTVSTGLLQRNLQYLEVGEPEANWYLMWLRSAATEQGPPESPVGQLADFVLAHPSFADAEGETDDFTRFINGQLSGRVWRKIAQSLARESLYREMLAGLLNDCFGSRGRYQPIIKALDRQICELQPGKVGPLLTWFGHKLVNNIREAHSGHQVGILTSLLSYESVPSSVVIPATNALAHAVKKELDLLLEQSRQLSVVHHRAQMGDFGASVEDLARKAMQEICPALVFVGDKLATHYLHSLWNTLSESLCVLDQNEMRTYFSSVLRLADQLGQWSREDPVGVWYTFFRPVYEHSQAKFIDWFISAGDVLLADPTPRNRERARLLLKLRNVPAETSRWFRVGASLPSGKRGLLTRLKGMVGMGTTKRIDSKDELRKRMGFAPDDAKQDGDEHDHRALNSISQRAAFAACAYSPNDPNLADIYFRLGSVEVRRSGTKQPEWSPRNPAIAIGAFASMDGHNSDQLTHGIDDLLHPVFLNSFRRYLQDRDLSVKHELAALCDEFESTLLRRGIDDATAAQAADHLRSKLRVSRSRVRAENQEKQAEVSA